MIKTNVHWGSAEFTIDDVQRENIKQSCFRVEPDGVPFVPPLSTLRKGQKRVDFPYSGSVYVRVFDDTRSIYIRKGLNQNAGVPTSDCFVVDGDENVHGDINRDYDSFTELWAMTDRSPLWGASLRRSRTASPPFKEGALYPHLEGLCIEEC